MTTSHSDLLNKLRTLANGSALQTVFIAGHGASGKTTLCNDLSQSPDLGVIIASLDWWLAQSTSERKADIQQAIASRDPQVIAEKENPQNWYDWKAFVIDLAQLWRKGRLDIKNAWNQETGNKDLDVSLEIAPRAPRLIIVEGIYLLHKPVSDMANLKILVEVDPALSIQRRKQRDERRSPAEYLAYKQALVEKYDVPYFERHKQEADIIIDGGGRDIERPSLSKLSDQLSVNRYNFMHLVLISGSHRQNSQSGRVAKYLAARLPALNSTTTTDIIDLVGNPLPLWDDENNSHATSPALQKIWQPYSDRLQKAEGFVVISPEWHGMVPSGLKNFFLYCTAKEMGHKPALITTVSASRGGSYPVAELRMSSYKNSRICYIPEHLIVRDAANMFAGDTPANKDDEFLRDRADFALRILLDYAAALGQVRKNNALYEKKYASGM